jgi:hypothetical protein
MAEVVENYFRFYFVCPGLNGHLNGTKDVDLLKVNDIVLQALQKKPVEAMTVVHFEVANDPNIAWLDFLGCIWGQV